MKRRLSTRAAIQSALIILGVILAAFIAGNVISFLTTRDRLPNNTYVGGVDVGGLSVDDAISRTIGTLQTPVALRYQGTIIQLAPNDVDFQINEVVARLQLDKVLRSQQGLDKLPDHIFRRSAETRVPAPYQYSESKLDDLLSRIAQDHDQQPKPAQPDLSTLTLAAGQDGMVLNADESRRLVLNALASGTSRFVDLPVDVVPNGIASVQSLGDLVKARLAPFVTAGSVPGVFIKDLKTGQEFSVNGDVAFSAPGWLKVAIVVEAYRAAADAAIPPLATQLAPLVTDGNSANANEILRTIGQGDPQVGSNQLNATLKRMGLVSTFLAQPFDLASKPVQFITPGNSRTDVNATPDSNAQSTPAEIGSLLEMLEQCHDKTGGLLLAFPSDFSPTKCDAVLTTLGQNSAKVLIAAGSPGATVIHRQSWDANDHGDAALVRTPGGNYVIAIMLHGTSVLNWGDTSLIISDIARAAYGFFNKGQVPPPVAAMNAAPPQ